MATPRVANPQVVRWRPEADFRLRQLWAFVPELSTREIGDALGVTKNAVIGRVRRLGLTPRPSPLRPAQPPRISGPRTLPVLVALAPPEPVEPRPAPPPPPPPRPKPPAPAAPAAPRPDTEGCRWPMWSDHGRVPRPPLFCGEPRKVRVSAAGAIRCAYCPGHDAMAWRPIARTA